jgi:hypothetical protein
MAYRYNEVRPHNAIGGSAARRCRARAHGRCHHIFARGTRIGLANSWNSSAAYSAREAQDPALEGAYLDLLDLSYYEPNEAGR